MANDMDFIGFKYNGTHSSYYEIFRTSDGSRYNDNLIPQLMEKTTDVPGGDGQYYFGSFYKTRQFSISIAFENLSEEKYREMRTWLDGKEIHDLIFDEAPYKVYSAKVTGTPQLKTICFEKDGARVYKGEGTIQFTCYYPFAHTPKLTDSGGDGRALNNYNITYYPNKTQWAAASNLTDNFIQSRDYGKNKGDLPTHFVLTYQSNGKSPSNPAHSGHNTSIIAGATFVVGDCYIELLEDLSEIKWDSKTGLVLGKKTSTDSFKAVSYKGKSYGTIPVGDAEDIDIHAYVKAPSYWVTLFPNDKGIKESTGEELAWYFPCTIEYDYWYY